jgi:hypothetical protein
MPSGDKSAYTDKQKRQAEHIQEEWGRRGVPENEAGRRVGARRPPVRPLPPVPCQNQGNSTTRQYASSMLIASRNV